MAEEHGFILKIVKMSQTIPFSTEHRKHGEVKSTMLESRVTTSFGKDYGFICTCITSSTKFPNYNHPCECIGAQDCS
ncbi:hypothetical protein MTR_2g047978 [Medicago truncatula]|uniref:Uncharacterized protein n=1 Tax=Medicago truncatula TaxID=3880 RepID=A0A072V861_MEDTR|nr:hypothetical protein MTR_2g047978 [Medicago truncatula]